MCWNGQIKVISNDREYQNTPHDLNVTKVRHSDKKVECERHSYTGGDVLLSSPCSSDFMDFDTDLDTDDEDNDRDCIDMTLDDDDWCSAVLEDEKLKCEPIMEVPISDYAREECVMTVPKSPIYCTSVDIDQCVGRLLLTEHSRREKVGILDRESILDLQAKSGALEEFSNISNEVVVGSEYSDVQCHIPLSESSMDQAWKTNITRVSGHMLSIQHTSVPHPPSGWFLCTV
jgi:hypothetical protein